MSSPSRASSDRRPRRDEEDRTASSDEASSRAGARHGAPAGPIDVPLAHARWHHFGWLVFGLIAGLLLVLELGTVGRFVGVVLLALALRHAIGFVRTLLYPAGTISVRDDQVILPRGLCRGKPATFPMEQVRHAFVLRRAVPWTQTGPLLVIEAGDRAFSYPRDWFLADADQQRIVRAVHHYAAQASR